MKTQETAKNLIINTLIDLIDCSREEAEMVTNDIVENLAKNEFHLRYESKIEDIQLLPVNPKFDEKNECYMSSEEVLTFIEREAKVTVLMETAFNKGSDTEDVFRGLMGDEGFENDDDLQDALISGTTVKHTFFISNARKETPFNEIGMVKRLIKDGFWTSIILHDYPIKDGLYAVIKKVSNRSDVCETCL